MIWSDCKSLLETIYIFAFFYQFWYVLVKLHILSRERERRSVKKLKLFKWPKTAPHEGRCCSAVFSIRELDDSHVST